VCCGRCSVGVKLNGADQPPEVMTSKLPAGGSTKGERAGPVRVFISYAHDDRPHEDRARRLWLFLREHGVDALLDLPAAEQRVDWAQWMALQLREADWVLVIASPEYKRRSEGDALPDEGRGVQWEGRLIRELFYANQDKGLRQILPVVLPDCSADDIPLWLAPVSATHYVVSDYTVAGAEKLLRVLTGQPWETEPPLGTVPVLRPHNEDQSVAPRRQAELAVLGPYGTAELIAALGALWPDREFLAAWDITALDELRRELTRMAGSPAHTRVTRVVECLVIAQKTITFLRSFMAVRLTSHALRRGLAPLRISGGSSATSPGDMSQITEVDAVEHVALTFPRAEGSCTAQMARFVLELADDAGVDLDSPELRGWAASIGAIVAFNGVLAIRRQRRAHRRLRLIVSLHYALAGDWPETLGAWLLYDDMFYDHEDFDCTPDQSGAEEALTSAVDWAEGHAANLGIILRRIEVAAPVRVLLRWRPEEVEYGPRLGVNYDVLAHWSRRLDPQPAMRRINRNVTRRLADIAACTDESRLYWLAGRQITETARLCEELRAGRYPAAIGLIDNPGANEELLELLLQFTPILLWPQGISLGSELRQLVASCWDLLPGELLIAYRARWRAEDGDLMADLRAVWDDQDWFEFCRGLLIPASARSRSI
jgi:NTP-dependent ternary conflict system VMAP-like protein/TIR domain-containing protein